MAMQGLPPVEKRTAFGPNGVAEMGQITEDVAEAVGCKSGPIKLLQGVQGRTGGFGLAHIKSKPSREKQITSLGHRTVEHYVYRIAQDYQKAGLQKDGRIVLITEVGGVYNHLICQWDETLEVWSVTTAIPKRNMRDVQVLWER